MRRSTIKASLRGKVIVWPVEEVAYFKADVKYVTAHNIDGRELLITDTICMLEAEFSALFVRSHRGVLVARRLINKVETDITTASGMVWLSGLPSPIACSRQNLPKLRRLLAAAH